MLLKPLNADSLVGVACCPDVIRRRSSPVDLTIASPVCLSLQPSAAVRPCSPVSPFIQYRRGRQVRGGRAVGPRPGRQARGKMSRCGCGAPWRGKLGHGPCGSMHYAWREARPRILASPRLRHLSSMRTWAVFWVFAPQASVVDDEVVSAWWACEAPHA